MHSMFWKTINELDSIPADFAESLWLYMCYGIEPGSFGMAVLTNDFFNAALRAHPALTSATFKSLAQWLLFCAPADSFGSVEKVHKWKLLSDEQRRDIMIEYELRPSVIQVLKGEEVA
jgi:hypothetical protein